MNQISNLMTLIFFGNKLPSPLQAECNKEWQPNSAGKIASCLAKTVGKTLAARKLRQERHVYSNFTET
jgi:hypothetical protein